jgi:5,10-methylene-tetrahydrofolate dehydrogenase/methenyl tetrahydrofolate cyclohydrolase
MSKLREIIRKVIKEETNQITEDNEKQKFVIYTNPNNLTSRAYLTWGTDDARDVMKGSKEYPGSYRILHQGRDTEDGARNFARKHFTNYSFGF